MKRARLVALALAALLWLPLAASPAEAGVVSNVQSADEGVLPPDVTELSEADQLALINSAGEVSTPADQPVLVTTDEQASLITSGRPIEEALQARPSMLPPSEPSCVPSSAQGETLCVGVEGENGLQPRNNEEARNATYPKDVCPISSTVSTGSTVFQRGVYCSATSWWIQRMRGEQVMGRVTGHIYFSLVPKMRANEGYIKSSVRIDSWTGSIPGITVTSKPSCGGSCTVVSNNWKIESYPLVNSASKPDGSMSFKTTLGGKKDVKSASGMYSFEMWVGSEKVLSGKQVHKMRCDNAAYGYSIGCVIPDSPATHLVSKTGQEQYHAHLLKAKAAGVVGFYSTNMLRRSMDTYTKTANNKKACGAGSGVPSPRPAGMQCDEYPFASTYNGAASSSTTRTYNGCGLLNMPREGAYPSRCLILAEHNQSGGNKLAVFYLNNRMADFEPFWIDIR